MTIPAWLKGSLFLAVAFAGGVAVGVSYEQHRLQTHVMKADGHVALEELARELNLDSTQQEAIAAIFARHQKDIDTTWQTMQPQVRDAMDAAHREVLAILRPDQAAKFQQLIGWRHPAGHR